MRLCIAIHLPYALLGHLHPGWQSRPLVVLHKQCVRLCSPVAAKAGIHAGMQQNSVRVLCPDALLFNYQPQLELQALQEVAGALLQYTPEVALVDEQGLVLDVTASLSLFGGPRALHCQVATTLRHLGHLATLAMAPTASGAWLLAVSQVRAARRCLKPGTLKKRLDRLPCTTLPELTPWLDWLDSIGCKTLGALRRLPRAGLKQRTHPKLLQTLDQAYGDAPEVQVWFQPDPVFVHQITLPERLGSSPALLHFARHLIKQLAHWLATRQLACTQLLFVFEHETGRLARPPSQLPVPFSEPVWLATDMLALFTEHLHRFRLPAPVIAVGLQVSQTQPLAPAPTSLFPEPGATATSRQHIIDLLVARLGRHNVLQAAPLADHRPEVANHWQTLACAGKAPSGPTPQPASGPRPFWLLPNPVPLATHQHRPFYGAQLQLEQGPERIEDGWWDDTPVQRDYYIARAPDGALYWLYLDRRQNRWFLHGLFA